MPWTGDRLLPVVLVGIWNRMEPVGNPASGSLIGAYYIAGFMPHVTKQASTTHDFQLFSSLIVGNSSSSN